jgi:hypothetical protein
VSLVRNLPQRLARPENQNQDLDAGCRNHRRMLVTGASSRPKVLRRAPHIEASNIWRPVHACWACGHRLVRNSARHRDSVLRFDDGRRSLFSVNLSRKPPSCQPPLISIRIYPYLRSSMFRDLCRVPAARHRLWSGCRIFSHSSEKSISSQVDSLLIIIREAYRSVALLWL